MVPQTLAVPLQEILYLRILPALFCIDGMKAGSTTGLYILDCFFDNLPPLLSIWCFGPPSLHPLLFENSLKLFPSDYLAFRCTSVFNLLTSKIFCVLLCMTYLKRLSLTAKTKFLMDYRELIPPLWASKIQMVHTETLGLAVCITAKSLSFISFNVPSSRYCCITWCFH